MRYAKAEAEVLVDGNALELLKGGRTPKGDVFEVARVAGITAAKRTSDIIPLCHNLPILHCDVSFRLEGNVLRITSEVKSIYRTGVEMEALTAVSVAALTVYDMLKPVSETLEIRGIRLLEKRGGRGEFRSRADGVRAAVFVISDSVFSGKKEDRSGRMIVERLKREGIEVGEYTVLPDEPERIEEELRRAVDEGYDLVITTGGTGFSRRDHTPEATRRVVEREAPGLSEFIRMYGSERTPYAFLSRGVAGISGKTLIVNLPGSRGGVRDALNALFPYINHAFKVMRIGGGGHAEGEGGP